MEDLLKLSGAELKAIADEKGINYPARITNPKLAELIHAENAKTENANVSQTVAQALKESDNDLLGDGDFAIVEGQMVKVITRKDGEVIEGEMSLDELMENELGTHLAFELAVNDKDAALARVAQLEQENRDLKEVNARLEASAMREVIGHPSQTPLAVHATEDGIYATIRPTWNNKESMKVRVRIMPNKGITSRIRSGMQFGVQYSEHEIDEATFNALIADSHLQVEVLDE